MNTKYFSFSFSVLLLFGFAIPAAAHEWSAGEPGGTIDASISCSSSANYNSFGEVTGFSTWADASNDHGAPQSVSGGPGELGPGGGSFSYSVTVSEIPGHAGTVATCEGNATPPEKNEEPPPPPPTCPDTSTFVVLLTPSSSITVGTETTAVAPTGWTGGRFISSNASVAVISNTTGPQTATVKGVGQGVSTISGTGWRASNGAVNCNLGGTFITVSQGHTGSINASANPLEICKPATAGAATITVKASTYVNVLVYGAEGIADGSLFFTSQANTETSQTTGPWVKNNTTFKVVAPHSNSQTLAELKITVISKDCQPPKVPWAAVYNTETVPAEYGPVPCGRLLAVWQNVGDPGQITGYRVYNESLSKYVQLPNPNQTKYEFDPKIDFSVPNVESGYSYALASYKDNRESVHTPAGSVAPILTCDPDLSPSNKDIVKIRDVTLSYDKTNQAPDANFKGTKALPVKDGDVIGFAINLVNRGYTPYKGSITVVDTMFNLYLPGNNANASVDCKNECEITKQEYDGANRRITFIVSPKGANTLERGESWTILFYAKTIAPTGSADIYRFQNRASVNTFTATWLETPYVPVLKDGGVPDIYEIQ